jgi:hypothetical protein
MSSDEGCYATHRYAADGNYTVGITKSTVPQSACAGQMKSITVAVKNTPMREDP